MAKKSAGKDVGQRCDRSRPASLCTERSTLNGVVVSVVCHVLLAALLLIPLSASVGFVDLTIETRMQQFSDREAVAFSDVEVSLAKMASDESLTRNNDSATAVAAMLRGPRGRVTEPSQLVPFPTHAISSDNPPSNPKASTLVEEPAGRILRPTGNAVSKGSFTVWTEPQSPAIRQDYWICISMKLEDKHIKRRNGRGLPAADITGRVVGSDGYSQRLLFDRRFPGVVEYVGRSGAFITARRNSRIPVFSKRVQIRVRVPGADLARTVDSVRLASKLLNEKQELRLVFGSRPRGKQRLGTRPSL